MIHQNERFDLRVVYEALTGYDTSTAKAARISRGGREIRVICPVHADAHPSCDLDLDRGLWICRSEFCGARGTAASMVILSGKVSGGNDRERYRNAYEWLRSLDPRNIVADKPIPAPKGGLGAANCVRYTKITHFPYTDANGNVVFEIIRKDGVNAEGEPDKDFSQRRKLPDAGEWFRVGDRWVYHDSNGKPVPWSDEDLEPVSLSMSRYDGSPRPRPRGPWVYSMRGLTATSNPSLVLYRLPEVRAAAAAGKVLIMDEGEAKTDYLRERSTFTVTTMHNGAGCELFDEWAMDVAGCSMLIILADSDPDGRAAAYRRAQHFRRTVFDVRIVDFYGDNSHRDGTDWLKERPQLSRHQVDEAILELALQTKGID